MKLLERPTITVAEYARVKRIGLNKAYDEVNAGHVDYERFGRIIRINTAPLRRRHLEVGA